MNVVEALNQLRPVWINRVSTRLARGEGIRMSFETQLQRFYDLTIHAVETGDARWLVSVLDEWVQARPEPDVNNFESTLPLILNEILLQTYEIVSEIFDAETGLSALGALLPIYTFAFSYVAVREDRLHSDQIRNELDDALLALEKLDKNKSDFIAIAAHELKTPLTLIEGYGAMLQERIVAGTTPEQVDILLRGIHTGTRRLKEIVDDMVDVSMIDNDLLTLNFQPVWLSKLFEIIQHEFRVILNERKLSLIVQQYNGIREMIFADSERLYQALRNLVANAIKFTPDGGRITIDGRMLPGFIETVITDTGIGIDPQDHIRIFEKFGRLENTALHSSGKTKFKGGGPGLGLPITKGIIEAHGGAIWVESSGRDEVNCPGATFHVLLPIRKEPPDEKITRLFRTTLEAEHLEGID